MSAVTKHFSEVPQAFLDAAMMPGGPGDDLNYRLRFPFTPSCAAACAACNRFS
jgi:hypothetical protein